MGPRLELRFSDSRTYAFDSVLCKLLPFSSTAFIEGDQNRYSKSNWMWKSKGDIYDDFQIPALDKSREQLELVLHSKLII